MVCTICWQELQTSDKNIGLKGMKNLKPYLKELIVTDGEGHVYARRMQECTYTHGTVASDVNCCLGYHPVSAAKNTPLVRHPRAHGNQRLCLRGCVCP